MATCSSADSVLDAASQIKSNAIKLNTFVNGTESQTVQLGEGNPTPSLRKFVADAQDVVTQAALDAGQTVLDDVAQNSASIESIWQYAPDSPCFFLFLDPSYPMLRSAVLADGNKIVTETEVDGTVVRRTHTSTPEDFNLFLQPDFAESSYIRTTENGLVLKNEKPSDSLHKSFLLPDASNDAMIFLDEQNSIIARIGTDGKVSFSVESENTDGGETIKDWPVPWIDGNRIMMSEAGGSSVVATAPSGNAIQSVFLQSENSFRVSCGQKSCSVTTDGVFVPDLDDGKLHCWMTIGQSLCVGGQGLPLVPTTPPVDGMALMLAGVGSMDIRMNMGGLNGNVNTLDPSTLTGFQDVASMRLSPTSSLGQTFAESVACSFARAELKSNHAWKSLWICAGVSGTSYSGLKKGTQPYANSITALTKAKQLAQSKGLELVVEALILKHGEADLNNADYYNNLIEWQSDYNTDIKGITGQTKNIPFLIAMPSCVYTYAYGSIEAMLRVAETNSNFHILGADYTYPYTDSLHLTGPGYYLLGETIANAVLEQAVFETCRCVKMLSATRTGTTVQATFSVPRPPLVIDTTTVEQPSGTVFGFSYLVDGVAASIISSVAITDNGSVNSPFGTATVTLQLSEEPSGQTETLCYALVGRPVDGYRARGNIRDSTGDVRKSTYDERRLDNWAIHQKINVQI